MRHHVNDALRQQRLCQTAYLLPVKLNLSQQLPKNTTESSPCNTFGFNEDQLEETRP